MGFIIEKLHIPDNSPEGRVIEGIVTREGVSPEEAVLRGLRQLAAEKSPAEEMWGAFSSPEDAAILDEAMEFVREQRKTWQPRDFDL